MGSETESEPDLISGIASGVEVIDDIVTALGEGISTWSVADPLGEIQCSLALTFVP